MNHHALLAAHLERSGLALWVAPIRLRAYGVLEVAAPSDLRRRLLASNHWVEDPLPAFRARLKPWVAYSVRERRLGPALHVEWEAGAVVVHVDSLNPGAIWPLFPLHAVIDMWGWKTVRPALLALFSD